MPLTERTHRSLHLCSCCRPWRSHLHFGYHHCRPCRPVMYVHLRLGPWTKLTLLHASSSPQPGVVFIKSSHTLPASLSIAFPLSSSYLFSMSVTFCTSVPIIVCIDLSMPSVSSLLSLWGLALAPPSGPSATVFGWLTWQLRWQKKPKKIEWSPLTSHRPTKRNTNHINMIQFSLFLCSKIAFDRRDEAREAVSKAREPQVIMRMRTLYSLDSCSCCMPKLNELV